MSKPAQTIRSEASDALSQLQVELDALTPESAERAAGQIARVARYMDGMEGDIRVMAELINDSPCATPIARQVARLALERIGR